MKDKNPKLSILKRLMAIYQIRLKDQDPEDLPGEDIKLPVPEQEEERDFRFFGELNFE